jgi:predicted N-acetyltransferase YhbS
MTLAIRRTIENDIPALARIVRRNYDKLTAEHFVPEIEMSFAPAPWRPWFYTAEMDGTIVGCGGYTASWVSYGAFVLCWFNVDPLFQRKGVGHALVDQSLRDLRDRANLVMLATSVPDFYANNWGFETLTKFAGDMMTDTLMALKFT